MSIMGLVPTPPGRIVGGVAWLDGEDLFAANDERIRQLRGKAVSHVFQDPLSTLHPLFTVGDQIIEAIRAHQPVSPARRRKAAEALLALVRIPNPAERLKAYPHELSGGMRQRVCIAMALANDAEVHHRRRADDGARRDRAGADPVAAGHAAPRARRRASCSSPTISAWSRRSATASR